MESQGSIGTGVTFVKVVDTNRNKELFDKETGAFYFCLMSDGSNKARCKRCGLLMSCASNTTMRSHRDRYCKALKSTPESGQSSMGADGSIWNYDLNMVRERMGKFVIQEGLPFDHFDNPRLTKLIRDVLQPRYTHVSRTTLRRDCLKMWQTAKNELILGFENLPTSVNLTSDVWSAPHSLPESYICVTAHWINPTTWQMMKRTIAFELFGYPHTGNRLFNILDYVLQTFKLENKVFSMSFDNASNNTNAIDKLKIKYKPVLDGGVYHSRCVAHIINLVVQSGLAVPRVEDFIKQFRSMLFDIFKKSRRRYMQYRKLCKDTNSICLGPNWDVPTRWNSTCKMFESALRQNDTLQLFHNSLAENGRAEAFPTEGWECIHDIVDFLQVFKIATTRLSGVYYPTSSLVLRELCYMTAKINFYEFKNDLFIDMITPMKIKFKKYFEKLPLVFTIYAALNPTINLLGVETLIDELNSNLCLYEENVYFAPTEKEKFKNNFEKLYKIYVEKYGPTTQINMFSNVSGAGGSSGSNLEYNLFNTLRNETSKRQRSSTPESEYGRYIGTYFLNHMTQQEFENFDILAWWKEKEPQYPILAAMARDLLTVQASTVASESAFSVSGRILSIRRTRLTPASVEMAICLKDHLDAAERIQHISSLEGELEVEEQIHEQEVETGHASPVSDEELAYDMSIRIPSSDDE